MCYSGTVWLLYLCGRIKYCTDVDTSTIWPNLFRFSQIRFCRFKAGSLGCQQNNIIDKPMFHLPNYVLVLQKLASGELWLTMSLSSSFTNSWVDVSKWQLSWTSSSDNNEKYIVPCTMYAGYEFWWRSCNASICISVSRCLPSYPGSSSIFLRGAG